MPLQFIPEAGAKQALSMLLKFRKGAKNERGLPVNLPYFMPQYVPKYEPRIKQAWSKLFNSPTPAVVRGLFTMTDDIFDDETYERHYEDWRGGFLIKRCDGHTISKQVNPDKSSGQPPHLFFNGHSPEGAGESNWHCHRGDGFACWDDQKRAGCKMTGRLRLRMPELCEVAGLPDGYVLFEHTAYSDDRSILSGLNYINAQYALKYGLPLSSIPLMIYRELQPVSGRKMPVICLSVDVEAFNKLNVTTPVIKNGDYAGKTVVKLPPQPEPDMRDDEQIAFGDEDYDPEAIQFDDDYDAIDPIPFGGESVADQLAQWTAQHVLADTMPFIHSFREWLNNHETYPEFDKFRNIDDMSIPLHVFCAEDEYVLLGDSISTVSEGKTTNYYVNAGLLAGRVYSRKAFEEVGLLVDKLKEVGDYPLSQLVPVDEVPDDKQAALILGFKLAMKVRQKDDMMYFDAQEMSMV